MKLIELYKKWMKSGELPDSGLCNSIQIKYEKLFLLFIPSRNECLALSKEGFDITYWASGLPADHKDEQIAFTPLRQTIVLLICAMAGEI